MAKLNRLSRQMHTDGITRLNLSYPMWVKNALNLKFSKRVPKYKSGKSHYVARPSVSMETALVLYLFRTGANRSDRSSMKRNGNLMIRS